MGALIPEVHRAVLARIPTEEALKIAGLVGAESLDPDLLESRGAGLADIVLVLTRIGTPEADSLIELIIGRPIVRVQAGPAMGDLPRPRRSAPGAREPRSAAPRPAAAGQRRLSRVGDNPHRPGTARALAFDKYAVGLSEADVRELVPARYIERHEADGLIEWEVVGDGA
jgi:hypothetical protein